MTRGTNYVSIPAKSEDIMTTPQPRWHGLDMLPTFSQVVDGMADSAQELYASLQQAKSRPTSLDDATVGRAIAMYSEQQEFYTYYQEQLARWLRAQPTVRQRAEIERLQSVMQILVPTAARLLRLAQKLAPYTIEKVMAMPDADVGMMYLSGGLVVTEDDEDATS